MQRLRGPPDREQPQRQVELMQRVIRLEPGTTKNSEGREVVMTDAVYAMFSACMIGKKADDSVLTRKNGTRQ